MRDEASLDIVDAAGVAAEADADKAANPTASVAIAAACLKTPNCFEAIVGLNSIKGIRLSCKRGPLAPICNLRQHKSYVNVNMLTV